MTDKNITLPTLERILYDENYGTDTRFGLGVEQIFVDPDIAEATITAILTDPTRDFSGVDIDSFVNNQLNFSTPEDIVATMVAIYENFATEDVNYIFFQILSDAFTNKAEFEEFFKTSWVALQITQNVVNPQPVDPIDLNLQGGGGCFIGEVALTPTVTPSLTATITPDVSPSLSPTPSVTASPTPSPTITPTFTTTPTITPEVTPTISVSPTPTPTSNPTPSPTNSVTPTSSVTPTPTLTSTPTATVGTTPTPTVTATTTVTPTPTFTVTPTVTPSITASITPSNTPSNTPPNSPPVSPAAPPPSPTVTPTPTDAGNLLVGTAFGLFGYFADNAGSPIAGAFAGTTLSGLPITRIAISKSGSTVTNLYVQVYNDTANITIDKFFITEFRVHNGQPGSVELVFPVSSATFSGGTPGVAATWIWDASDGVGAIQAWNVGEIHNARGAGGPAPTVSASNTPTPTPTPTSVPISVTPTPAPTSTPSGMVVLPAANTVYYADGVTTAYVQLHYENDGQFGVGSSFIAGPTYQAGQWWSSEPQAGVGNNYEVRITETTINSTFSRTGNATVGIWEPLTSNKIYRWERFAGSPLAGVNILVEIRNATSLVVEASTPASISLGALIGPGFP